MFLGYLETFHFFLKHHYTRNFKHLTCQCLFIRYLYPVPCTPFRTRSVPLHWFVNGFRAFDNIFYNRNSIRSCAWSDGNREDVLQSVVGTESDSFRVLFAYFSGSIPRIQYKKREIGGQIATNLGICHHFYILTLTDNMIKQCSLSIYRVSGGWDASVYHFMYYCLLGVN